MTHRRSRNRWNVSRVLSFWKSARGNPRAIVRLEGLGELENPLTSSGIEPAILQLVAHLKIWKKLFCMELKMDFLSVMFMKLGPKI
jgi:hypothetical protein